MSSLEEETVGVSMSLRPEDSEDEAEECCEENESNDCKGATFSDFSLPLSCFRHQDHSDDDKTI